jgi:hypothetical protein
MFIGTDLRYRRRFYMSLIAPFATLVSQIVVEAAREGGEVLNAVGIARTIRARNVVILGKDTGDEYLLLKRAQAEVERAGYSAAIVKDQEELPELSNEDKVRLLCDLSRFVVCENSYASGHLTELKMCSTNRIVTVVLRETGKGGSFMVADYPFDFSFMREFEYGGSGSTTLEVATRNGISWAEERIEEKRRYLTRLYPWRS